VKRALCILLFALAAEGRSKIVQSLDVDIPAAPMPVAIDGKRVLTYELHLTNLRPAEVTLTRLEIHDAARNTQLAEYRDGDLAHRLGRPSIRPAPPDTRLLAGGTRAVLYVWLALDDGTATPARLRHVIETGDGVMEGAEIDVRTGSPVVLDPPLRGGPWVALYDPLMMGGHRTAIYTLEGRARIPARFAIDGFEVVGTFDSIEQATSGVRWQDASSVRRMELPKANVVVTFK
jgi:hypothetical protein